MTQFSRLYRVYQNIAISGIIVLLSIVGVVVGVIPAAQKIFDQMSVSSELAQELDTLQRKIDVLDSLDEDSLRNNLDTVLSAVPGSKSIPTLFTSVEGVAARAGVEITDMTIAGVGNVSTQSGVQSALEKQLGTRVMPFSVTVQGPISAIQQFIVLTPTVRRLLRLRTFAITFPEDEEVMRVNLQMDAFYEPFPNSLGSVSTVITPLSEKEQALIERVSQFELISGVAAVLPPPSIGEGKVNPFAP